MPNQVRRSPILNGGNGCAVCTRISVDTLTGALRIESPGQVIPAKSFPVRVGYDYSSRSAYSDLFGRGREGIGEPGQFVNDLAGADPYGFVIVQDGGSLAFTGSGDGINWIGPVGSPAELLKLGGSTGWLYLSINGYRVAYDGYGTAKERLDPSSANRHYYEYDSVGASPRLLRIRDGSDRVSYFRYGSDPQAIAFTTWAGRSTYFAYDAYGCLTRLTGPSGCQTQFAYDAAKRLTSITDGDGYAVYFAYDASGNLASETVPNVSDTYFTYDTTNGRTTVKDSRGNFSYYEYSQGVLSKFIDPMNNQTYFTGDSLVRDANFHLTYFQRDSAGNVIVERTPAGVSYFAFDSRQQLTTDIDRRGFAEVYTYDTNGGLYSFQDRLSQLTSFSCDTARQPLWIRDPRSNLTYFSYDAYGNATRVADAYLVPAYFAYDANGNTIASTDRNGATTYFSYDADDRLTGAIDALGGLHQIGYTATGLPSVYIDPANATSYATYSVFRKVSTTRDALGKWAYFTYDAVGNLIKRIDERNSPTYFLYDPASRLVAVTDALNSQTYFNRDNVGNATIVRDARMFATNLSYDASDRLYYVLDPLSNPTQYFYDSESNITSIIDARGQAWTSSYDANGQRKTFAKPIGGTTTFNYDENGNLTSLYEPDSSRTYYQYDKLNRPVLQLDALDRPTYFVYDPVGNPISVTDARIHTTAMGFDSLRRMTSVVDPLAAATYFAYDAVGNLTAITDARGNTAWFGYDPLRRPTAAQDAVGNSTYLAYDAGGNVTAAKDARGSSSYFTYDLVGRPETSIDRASNPESYTHDAVGNLVQRIDRRGYATYFAYDAIGRVTTYKDAYATPTAVSYERSGAAMLVAPPVGGSLYFQYDALDRLSLMCNGVYAITYFVYDPQRDNLIRRVSPRLYSTYFAYDAVHRVTAIYDELSGGVGSGTYFSYDTVGNVASRWDSLNRATYYTYDDCDRLTITTDPLNASTYFAYDAVGNRIAEVNPLIKPCYFGYDNLNRLVTDKDQLGVTSYYTYDENSNVSVMIDRLGTPTYFTYDKMDRVTSVGQAWGYGLMPYGSGPYGSAVFNPVFSSFTYDENGNVLTAVGAQGTDTFTYDRLNRMDTRRPPSGGTMYFDYDSMSNRTRFQYPFPLSTSSAYFKFDEAQRVSWINAPAGSWSYFVYDASSNLSARRFGNGTRCYYTYDTAERALRIRHVLGTAAPLAYFDMARDAMGQVTSITRETDQRVYYSYDDGGRLMSEIWKLKSANTQNYGFWYDYDKAGNRLWRKREYAAGVAWDSAYYTYNDANAVTFRRVLPSDTRTYFYYDANGALTAMREGVDPTYATTYFSYGPHQFITQIKPPTGSPWNFYYDAKLNRYAIDRGGSLSYFIWDGLDPVEERDASGALIARYVNGGNRIPGIGSVAEVQRVVSGITYFQYLHTDQQGSVACWTDGAQSVRTTYVNDAFGAQVGAPSGPGVAIPNDFQFQSNWMTVTINGRRYGLSPSRVYDPELGRFLQSDPLPSALRVIQNTDGNAFGIYANAIFEDVLWEDLLDILAGVNAYVYAEDAPVGAMDPEGLINTSWQSQPKPKPKKSDESVLVYRKKLAEAMRRLGCKAGDLACAEKASQLAGTLPDTGFWDSVGQGIYVATGEDSKTFDYISDFSAGMGDHLSFGTTDLLRGYLGLNDYVNKCTAYDFGGYSGLVIETLATGGSAILKAKAKKIIAERMLNNRQTRTKAIASLGGADRKALDKALGGRVGDQLQAHHRYPLLGHSRTGAPALFPTMGLPAAVKNGRWNGVLLSEAAHTAEHVRLEAWEKAARVLGYGNIPTMITRDGLTALRTAIADCECAE